MTTYEIKGSANYCAECIEAPAWEDMIQFPTLQNLRGIPWAGYTILVPRDYAGARLVVFPAESQLSETVAHDLNLHAKAELNADTTLSGYLACNRRIKAIRLRGVPSNALALPAEYFGSPAVGEVFDTVDGVPVSRKYVVPQKASNGTSGKRVERLWRRVEDKMLPMHYDTGQYWRESDKFADDDMLVVTQKLHGCLAHDTKILMADGTQMKVGHLVKSKFDGYVMGVDETGRVRPTKVTNVFDNGRNEGKWLDVKVSGRYKGKNNRTSKLVVTENHRFFSPGNVRADEEGYVAASELREGDTLLSYDHHVTMPYIVQQVLMGKMMGDGSLNKKRDSITWGQVAPEYVEYTKRLLGTFAVDAVHIATSGYGSTMYRNASVANHRTTELFSEWVETGRKEFPKTSIRLVGPLALAIWYMDDGSLGHHETQRDRANIAVNAYSEESVSNLVSVLDKFGIEAVSYESRGWRLRMNADEADKFFNIIAPYVPPAMQYKLPEKYRGLYQEPAVGVPENELYEVRVLSVDEVPALSKRYDLETETHNYIAGGIVVHNSSARIANTIVKRKLSWLERLLQRIGVRVQDTEFDVIGGSRKVIKDPTNPNQQQRHFYDLDIWTHAAQRFGSVIPKNVILYGELVGWLPDTSTPIQRGYTYRIPVGVYEFFVYRVAVVTEDGGLYDLSWDGVREFCAARGLNHVPELWRGRKSEFDPTHWTDQRFAEAASAARLTGVELFRDIPLPLADESPVDEGVVTLREGVVPFALKVKSPVFLEHESISLDKEDE